MIAYIPSLVTRPRVIFIDFLRSMQTQNHGRFAMMLTPTPIYYIVHVKVSIMSYEQ